jgi:hypothetical protein
MNQDKIKAMAEHVITSAYDYAKDTGITNNEAMNAMLGVTVAMAIGLKDDKTDMNDLQFNITVAINGYFDSMREANSL